jgi:hypothetical protein
MLDFMFDVGGSQVRIESFTAVVDCFFFLNFFFTVAFDEKFFQFVWIEQFHKR